MTTERAAVDYRGRCHCGAIGFTYTCAAPTREWAIRACQCRFCRVHDALSASDPDATIAFEAAEPDQLQRYRFGLRTADFLICRRCGSYLGAMIETPRGRFGIINTHSLVDPTPETPAPMPMSYDGEETAARVARREQRWSPVRGFPD